MPQNLDGHEIESDGLTERQQRLMVWRDYFKMLRKGIAGMDKGSSDKPWSEVEVKTRLMLDVVITEIEGDIMHLQCNQEEYCRWGDAKDLSKLDGNIDVRDE